MSITIQDDFAVQASEQYSFTNEDGFIIPTRGDGTVSSFWNFGTISLTVDGGEEPPYGYHIIDSAGGAEGGVIRNATGGAIEATSAIGAGINAIDVETLSQDIRNDGVIRISTAGVAQGVRVSYGDHTSAKVVNTGLIELRGDEWAAGVSFGYGGTIINSGVVKVVGGSALGVGPGIFESHVENTGKIIARALDAPDSVGVHLGSFSAGSTFLNEGLIRADFAIRGDVSGYELSNAGKLIGDVWLYGGNNQGFTNTGLIRGDILLGEGGDHYDGSAGKLSGAVYGGGGSDLLVCGKGDQILHGDDVPGFGQDGADTLVGGLGSDTLIGGGGEDVFVFQSLGETKVGGEDLIRQLSDKDVIDLSAIDADAATAGDQAFHLVGALGGHAGEAALVYDSGRKLTLLQLDVDGDGSADAQVAITGDQTDFTHFVL
jgi:hypothetical protein